MSRVFALEPHALDAFSQVETVLPNIPCPRLRDEEILVKVESMMEDPSDWRKVDTVTHEYTHSTHGCDFSGLVVKIGRKVTCGISLGDHVVGFVLSNAVQHVSYTDAASNARYIRLAGELAWVVPKGTFTHDDAAKARLGRFRYMFGTVP